MIDKGRNNSVDISAHEGQYRHEERRVHRICYHVVWSVRRGSAVFRNEAVREECEQLIRQTCRARRWEVLSLEVLPNHVRLAVQVWPADAADRVIRTCKDATVQLREKWQPTLPSMWTHGFLADTQSPDEEAIQQHLLAERERG